MLQAPQFDSPSLDSFSLQQDGLASPEVDVGGCEIVEALVIAAMIVALDEGCDLGFEIARQEIVLQQDAVLQCLVPALNLALWSEGGNGLLTVDLVRELPEAMKPRRIEIAGKQPGEIRQVESDQIAA